MAIFNIVAPVMFVSTTALHTAKRGLYAYQGAFTFWFVGIPFIIQLLVDSVCLYVAISRDDTDGWDTAAYPSIAEAAENAKLNSNSHSQSSTIQV